MLSVGGEELFRIDLPKTLFARLFFLARNLNGSGAPIGDMRFKSGDEYRTNKESASVTVGWRF